MAGDQLSDPARQSSRCRSRGGRQAEKELHLRDSSQRKMPDLEHRLLQVGHEFARHDELLAELAAQPLDVKPASYFAGSILLTWGLAGYSGSAVALDHYVPQVHLRNFYSHELGRRMYGLRKSDLRAFTCRSEDVCRIEAGSTNPYLKEPRIIEDFLTEVEPYYNASVANLRSDTIDHRTVFAI